MNTIPEELLEQVEQGNVLLFIGERILHDAAGEVAFEQLAAQFVMRAGIRDAQGLTFAQIAQLYEDEKGTHELLLFVKRYFEELGNHPQAVHRLIAELTDCTILATTCFDGRLEQAFEEAGRPLNPIIGNVDVAFEDERDTQLYKLRGSLERIESLILTEDAYETFFEDHASISLVLQGYLARKTMLFVGYDLTDPHFKRLYRKVIAPLDHLTRRAYAFGAALPAHTASWAKRRQIEVIEADVTRFFESLTAQLAERKRAFDRLRQQEDKLRQQEDKINSQSDGLPERPYKFLDYYEAKDAGIFYGRQQETQHLCALIHAHRLVLLYGASGVGKTSLLLAGAVPRLEQSTQPYHAIYIRALEDPTIVIRHTLRRQLPDANLPDESLLVDFLSAVTHTLGQPLVIVLDQFEEFFIRLSPQFRAAFISELGALYDARDVPVKVIFSLREDWLASMDEIEERIPDLFRTRMRVLRLNETQAHQAITGPVKQLGISYEPSLLERLLADLLGSNQEVMPPQLQLVCSALYDGRQEDEQVIRLATYERLGGVQGVLRRYLEEELTRLKPAEQALARAVLEELVTSEKTKAVKSSASLALALEAHLETLESVLERLVRGRLLRTVKDKTGHSAYELAHEYLIHEISLTADSQARKQAEELLQQEVENGQRFGTVLAADKLALIGEVRNLLRLNDDAQALLLQSALQVGQDIEYWLNRISEPTRRVELLTQATQSKLAIVRQRAAETLGTQDMPQSVAPLLTLALHDSNMDVRDTANESLAQLTKQHPAIVARLKSEAAADEVEDTASSTRVTVLRTLTYLPLSGLPLSLRAEVLMMRIRLRLTWLIQASLATPQRRAIAMTTALLVLLVMLTYIFSTNAYYVDIRLSRVPEGEDVIVIRRGYPLLKFPGLSQVLVDTGIKKSQIASDQWTAIRSEQLWGLSSQTVEGGFYKWAQDVANTLKLEHQASMLWYLGQQEDALQVILEAMRSQDTQLYGTSVVLLEEIVKVEPQLVEANPQLTEQVIPTLLRLLEHEEWQVRFYAASSLAQVAEGNSQLTEQVIAALLRLLEDESIHVRDRAESAVGRVVEGNPQLAEQVLQALLPLLEDENREAQDSAWSALAQVAQASPQLARQVLQALLPLLENSSWVERERAAFTLAQVVEGNPQLTEEVTAALLPLLEHNNIDVRYEAASALALVAEGNPQLAEQLIVALQPLLEEEDWERRFHDAMSALVQVAEGNPQLTEEVTAALLPLLEDNNVYARESATFAVEQVVEAQLTTQKVAKALLKRLEDREPNVASSAVRSLAQILLIDSEAGSFVQEELLVRLSDEDEFVRAGAAETVGLVIESRPEIANQEVVDKLLSLLTDTSGKVCDQAGFALGEVVKVKPEVTPLVANRLIPLLLARDKEEGYNIRDNTALAWAHLVTASPESASQNPQMTDAVIDLLNYGEQPVRARATTALAMIGVVTSQPDTSQIVEALVARLASTREQDGDVQNRTIKALAQLYTGQPSPPSLNLLIPSLTAPLDSQQRRLDSQALFLVALWEPSLEQEIGEELEELSNSQEPHERLIANQTLQMLKMARQAHEAAKLDGTQREEATNRLQTLCQWRDYSHRCTTANFFGEEFTWAAWEAVNWLEEQADEENAQ